MTPANVGGKLIENNPLDLLWKNPVVRSFK